MDDPSGNLFSLIVLLLSAATFVTLSLLFSASESAFLALNKLRVHFLRKKGDKRAVRAGKLLDKKEELLNMLLVGNEIVNVALSVVLTSVFLKLFGPKGLGIATGISTVLLLIFGEITPKSVTTRHPEAIAFGLSGFVTFFFYLLRPFVIFFTFISRSILKMFGIDTKKKNVSFTEDEIKTFIDVGGEEGVLENGEKKMMNRVFKFTDLAAVDIMIPRRKIVGIQPDAKYRDIIQLSERTRLSRFPVYREDIDDIIGVLYVKDLLYFDPKDGDFSVGRMMREPLFIPGTTKMSSVQSLMYERKENFAVVIDEYSGTDGILTSEDIAREIFGGIADDFEQSGRATGVEKAAEDKFADTILEGSCRLVDLEENLHIKLESKMNETLAGFITEQLDRMPMLGDSVEVSGYKFTVEAFEALRISKIRCVRLVTEDDELTMEENEDESAV
ncbi:hemolysin family protein [Treponema zioleckii]|uniref:hemolysin family protein n=1 Tax=Treponema zioleckii TaxID=331680 RepID=UPI00168ABC81|nr:hemolysin family protein [Treponema zioleckii]